jgi:hypothetical protein
MFTGIRISFRCGFAVTLSILTAWGLAPTTFGQTADYWLNPNGGNYENGSNWSLGAPGAYPLFNLGSSGYAIGLNQNDSAVDPVVETDNPTIELGGHTYTTDYLDVSTAANTNGSLTFVGPGTYVNVVGGSIPFPSYLNVGNGSNSAQFTVDDATVSLPAESSLSVSAGSTMTVENGGAVTQSDPLYSMSIANLLVNDGTVSTQGAMNLGSAMLTDGSNVVQGSGAGSFNVSGTVVVDDSTLQAIGSPINFGKSASLTLTDGAQVSFVGNSLALNGSIDILSGQLQADAQTEDLDTAVTIVLNANMVGVAGSAFISHFDVTGGTLTIELPNGFMPAVGEQFQLFDNIFTDPLTGSFDSVALPPLPGGESWDTSQLYSTGIISVVPEPTNIALILAAGGLLIRRRRKS